MVTTKRSKENPILYPEKDNNWESEAAFNGSVVKEGSTYTMVYRALSVSHLFEDKRLKLSTIGMAQSGDGVHFKKRRQFITPQEKWEKYGCEDPRITKFEGKYYIFYTALSTWPPNAEGIKVAVAITSDLEHIEERHLVTPFNAKAMGIFSERINGKIAVIFTAHTDSPPAKICIALLDSIEQLWDQKWWNEWHKNIDKYVVPIYHTKEDHLEVGAAPVLTDKGWILVFSYIENYFRDNRIFRIDAALLDLQNPYKLIGQTLDPLLIPEEQYELYGMVPNVIFPSGALLDEGQFFVYYSACDTSVCRAGITLNDLIDELRHNPTVNPHHKHPEIVARFERNPIISPISDHPWESKYTFNAGAIYVGGKIHILYRAMGDDDTSVLGYASTTDGLHIEERLDHPVYVPREGFELKHHPGFSGCEDPRLSQIGNTIYMCYTAFDGINPPRIALTTIGVDDFVNNKWNWSRPKLISAPGMDNKDSCIVSNKIDNKYAIFHRLPPCIWIDFVSDLEFDLYLLIVV